MFTLLMSVPCHHLPSPLIVPEDPELGGGGGGHLPWRYVSLYYGDPGQSVVDLNTKNGMSK